MQLVTPRVVAIAVAIDTMSWIISFQVFLFSNFHVNSASEGWVNTESWNNPTTTWNFLVPWGRCLADSRLCCPRQTTAFGCRRYLSWVWLTMLRLLSASFNSKFGCKYNDFCRCRQIICPKMLFSSPTNGQTWGWLPQKPCRTIPRAGTPWRLTLPYQFDKGSNSGSITSLFS